MLFAAGRKVVALAREEATSSGKRKRMLLADSTSNARCRDSGVHACGGRRTGLTHTPDGSKCSTAESPEAIWMRANVVTRIPVESASSAKRALAAPGLLAAIVACTARRRGSRSKAFR